MTFRAIGLYALRAVFGAPRGGGEADSAGVLPPKRSMRGSLVAVGISIVPLIVVMVVSDGMIAGITDRYVELGTYHFQAMPYRGAGEAEMESTASRIAAIEGVASATEEIRSAVLAVAPGTGKRAGAAARAFSPAYIASDPGFGRYLRAVSGEVKLDRPNDALIGSELARRLGVVPGDALSLVAIRNGPSGEMRPKVGLFRVKGIISSGYQELDALWVILPLEAGRRLMEPSRSQRVIGVKVADPAKAAALRNKIEEAAGPDYCLYGWEELEANLFRSFETTRLLLILIMCLIVLVAAINVSSTLIMASLERSRDIAILKALGARPRDVAFIFIFAGCLVGCAGATLGMALGLLASSQVNVAIGLLDKAVSFVASLAAGEARSTSVLNPEYYLSRIPISLKLGELIVVAASTVFLSLVASTLPAIKAARLFPLDAIRKH